MGIDQDGSADKAAAKRVDETVASHPRLLLIERVGEAFEEAGVNYTLLHDWTAGQGGDSDLDIAVDPESRDLVDWIIRVGTFGRLLQRLDYDVPWCRYYVVESEEPGRRYRQIDVACDPWGIGRYGGSIRLALASAEQSHGHRVASPAAQTVYLALKRASKGSLRPGDGDELRSVFRRDPAAASDLLEQHLGKTGAALAVALERDRQDLTTVLLRLRREAARARWRPARAWRRALFSSFRLGRRILRPAGLVVCLAGPDGTGKSTLATALEDTSHGLFRRVARIHVTPGLLPSPARLLGRNVDHSTPHRRPPSNSLGSVFRLVYLAADSLAGWLPRVTVPRIRSTLVVIERGWDDLAIDPLRYRLSSARGLVELGRRLLPRPDVTVVLDAPADAIHARKPELTTEEIARQLEHWRVFAAALPSEFITVDASSLETALAGSLAGVEQRLAARVGELSRLQPALDCLGRPSAAGRRYSVIDAGGKPRWITPLRRGAPGPLGTRLYRPASLKHYLGAVSLEVARRLGLSTRMVLAVDSSQGLAPELAAALGVDRVEIAAMLSTDPARSSRVVLSAIHRGRPIALIKAAPKGSAELQIELRALCAFESIPTRAIIAPRVLAWFPWRGFDVLATTPLEHRGRTSRVIGATEEAALVELASYSDRFVGVLSGAGTAVVHGDFSGWNTSALRGSRLATWDWEWAHLGEPLEDWFHWQTQRLVHFRAGSTEELVRCALYPGAPLRALCTRLGVDAGAAALGLAASLRHGLANLASKDEGRGVKIREEALALLEGRT